MKTETKHTPGPWHIGVRQPNSDKFIYGPKGSEVADCDRQTNFPAENLANARLIASAPRLLEERDALLAALTTIATQCGSFSEPGKAQLDYATIGNIARAAIAKVGGAS